MQVLQKKFNDFKSDTQASSVLYTVANNLARKLVAEGHSDTVFIKEKQDAMRYGTCMFQLLHSKTLTVKHFGELKSICIGNVMEIVKIGGKNLMNCCNSPNLPKFLLTMFLL